MKKTLLSLLLLSAANLLQAQNVNSLYGDGVLVNYTFVTSATPLSHGTGGADQVWNFDNLVEVAVSESHSTTPQAADLVTYPSATNVLETSTQVGAETILNRLLWQNDNGEISIVGANTTEIALNYTANPVTIGTFPLAFGYSHTDSNVGGTFSAMSYAGTFNGTATTSIDAFGTLTANIGNFDAGTVVTRLKTVQNLNLVYMFMTVGTVVQTTYSYYANDMEGFPIFRSTESEISVPILQLDYTTISDETFQAQLLSADEFKSDKKVVIAPNPVRDILRPMAEQPVTGIEIFDINGRLLTKADASEVNVSGLSSGTYISVITFADGKSVHKFVK